MAVKFAQPQSIRLSCLGAMLEAYHKPPLKPKTVLKLKDVLQQIWTALLQKSNHWRYEGLLQANRGLCAS